MRGELRFEKETKTENGSQCRIVVDEEEIAIYSSEAGEEELDAELSSWLEDEGFTVPSSWTGTFDSSAYTGEHGKEFVKFAYIPKDAEGRLLLKRFLKRLLFGNPRAVYKDGAVRCEECGAEIWEGVDCDCGIDGADHPGFEEAYEAKAEELTGRQLPRNTQNIGGGFEGKRIEAEVKVSESKPIRSKKGKIYTRKKHRRRKPRR